jgi:hypothetical protein
VGALIRAGAGAVKRFRRSGGDGRPVARASAIGSRIGALSPQEPRTVPIDLDDLVVLEDQTVGPDEESLLELVFPESFYVVGTEGNCLTTVNNLELFQRVVELIGADTVLDDPAFRDEVQAILEEADDLAQEDYDEAVERDVGDADEEFEDEKDDDWER